MRVALPLFQTGIAEIIYFQMFWQALAPFVWQPRGCKCTCVASALLFLLEIHSGILDQMK